MMVEHERREHIEIFLPELLIGLREAISGEITSAIANAYERAFADLRADLNALHQAVKKFAGDDSTVIDLPSLRVGGPLN